MEANIVIHLRSLNILHDLNLNIIMNILQFFIIDLFQDVISIWTTQTKIKHYHYNDLLIGFNSPIEFLNIQSKHIRIIEEKDSQEYELLDNPDSSLIGKSNPFKLTSSDARHKIGILRKNTL